MGKLVGYGLRKPVLAGEMGYMLGVCLKTKLFHQTEASPETKSSNYYYHSCQNLFENKYKTLLLFDLLFLPNLKR